MEEMTYKKYIITSECVTGYKRAKLKNGNAKMKDIYLKRGLKVLKTTTRSAHTDKQIQK